MTAIETKISQVKLLYPKTPAFLEFLAEIEMLLGERPGVTFGITNHSHSQMVNFVCFGDVLLKSNFDLDIEAIAKKHQDLALDQSLSKFLSWTETFSFKNYFTIRIAAKGSLFESANNKAEARIEAVCEAFSKCKLNDSHELTVINNGTSFIDLHFISKD